MTRGVLIHCNKGSVTRGVLIHSTVIKVVSDSSSSYIHPTVIKVVSDSRSSYTPYCNKGCQ